MDEPTTTCHSCDREIDDALTWCPFCGAEQGDNGEETGASENTEPDAAPAGSASWFGSRAGVLTLAALLIGGAVAVWFFFIRDDDRGAISLLDIGPGDCWVDPAAGGDAIDSVPEIPCAEPHTFEVFAAFDLTGAAGDPYPTETIAGSAETGCRNRLGAYTGVAYADSPLDVWPLYPTGSSWAEGDREVICSLYAVDGTDLIGSQRNAGERLAVPTTDAGAIADCAGLAGATVPIAQVFVDFVDGAITADDSEEFPAELVSAYKSELLLTGRALELGCGLDDLNASFAELATGLTARTDAGRALVDDYAANGYFATG
jgi:hypothetical protein